MSASSFEGLRVASFDAYLPEKWASNVFTRERLEVKQRLLSLARGLEPKLSAVELKLQRYASDEYPSLRNGKSVDAQWVFFWRTEEERIILEREVDLEKTLAATLADPTPMTRHAFLCLRLDQDGLEMSFRLHRNAWVDQHNLINKLANSEHLSTFVEILREQPQPFSVSADGKALEIDAMDEESLLSLLRRHGEGGESFLTLGLLLSKERTLELGPELIGFLETRLEALTKLYGFVAWTEENNYVSSDEEFLQRQAQRGARRQELDAGEEQRRAALEVKKREQEAARRELEEVFRREAAAKPAAPSRPRSFHKSPRSSSGSKQDTEHQQGPLKPEKRDEKAAVQTSKAKVLPSEPQPVQKGHRARVLRGPFAGQVGLVQEVDSRGTARIMVGLLATRIPVEDLLGLGSD